MMIMMEIITTTTTMIMIITVVMKTIMMVMALPMTRMTAPMVVSGKIKIVEDSRVVKYTHFSELCLRPVRATERGH